MSTSEFSSFPLREGGSVPREFVLPMEDALLRGYGQSLKMLAARGNVSVYEILMHLPAPEGVDQQSHRRSVCEMTISEARGALEEELLKFHKKKEADAEAEMLRLMEEGAA